MGELVLRLCLELAKTLSAQDKRVKLQSMVMSGGHSLAAKPTASCLVVISPLDGDRATQKQQQGA